MTHISSFTLMALPRQSVSVFYTPIQCPEVTVRLLNDGDCSCWRRFERRPRALGTPASGQPLLHKQSLTYEHKL